MDEEESVVLLAEISEGFIYGGEGSIPNWGGYQDHAYLGIGMRDFSWLSWEDLGSISHVRCSV